MREHRLSALEGAMLIAGSGLGTGILAIPYAASKVGFYSVLLCIAAAYTVSVFLHLLVADLVLHSKNSTQLIGIFREHLFTGPNGKIWTLFFFLVLAAVLFLNLTIYIVVASNVITDLLDWSGPLTKFIFYGLASLVVLMGIRVIGISEKYSMIFIGLAVLYLSVLANWNTARGLIFSFGEPSSAAVLYGLCMFSFSALFSVPQVVNHIEDKSRIRQAIIGGIGTNAVITLIFTVAVLTASEEITSVATIGLSRSLGLASRIACALFVLLAMLTSYWSIALAQLDILREQTGLARNWCWLIATLPTLFIAIFLPADLIDYIQIAGGSVAVIIGCMILPSYYRSIKDSKDGLILGDVGKSKSLLVIIFLFYLLMAGSSFIKI